MNDQFVKWNVEHGLLGRLKAQAATRLIRSSRTQEQTVCAFHQTLSPVRRSSASNTDRKCFRDVLRHTEQLWHGIKRPPAKILVQTGDNHTFSRVGKLVAHGHKPQVKELPLVNPNDLRAFIDQIKNLCGSKDKLRFDFHITVANDMILTVPSVELWFEYLHSLSRDLRPAQPADQLLTFTAEHAPADHLDPPEISAMILDLLGHR